MEVSPAPNTTSCKEDHPEKAESPIVVNELGKTNFVTLDL